MNINDILNSKFNSTISPSGNENNYIELIKNEIEGYVDKVYTDNLGNLIAKKSGTSDKTILFTAHADERSVVVTSVNDNGTLNFAVAGNTECINLISQKVVFQNGVYGIIMNDKNADISKLSANDLFIDTGADNKADAEKEINIGDLAVFEHSICEKSGKIIGSSLDNKIGVLMLCELIKNNSLPDYTKFFAFTTYRHVNSRGAKAVGFSIDSDIAIDFDLTPASDTQSNSTATEIKLGGGACIKVKDSSMIARRSVVKMFKDTARRLDMPFQIEISDMPKSRAAAVQQSKSGNYSVGISVPARYIGTMYETVNINDINDVLKLVNNIII